LAANQGDLHSISEIGLIYKEGGYGIERNYNEALKWFEKGAYLGGQSAQWRLGLMHPDSVRFWSISPLVWIFTPRIGTVFLSER
jgi:TPR repeat protein